jgi:hypothetical protein
MANELKDCFDGAKPGGGVVAVFNLLQVEGWWRGVIFRGRRSTVQGRDAILLFRRSVSQTQALPS